MKALRGEGGFTLVEMLVVLSILALTLMVSLPYVRGSGDARILEAAAQTVAARLRQTQAAAVATNSEKIISFDLKNAMIVEPPFSFPTGTQIKIETAQGLISADTTSFRFFADGGSSGGKIIMTKGKASFEIDLNWLTGAVVIAPGKSS